MGDVIDLLTGATQDLKESNDRFAREGYEREKKALRESFDQNAHLIPHYIDDTVVRLLWQIAFADGVRFGVNELAGRLSK